MLDSLPPFSNSVLSPPPPTKAQQFFLPLIPAGKKVAKTVAEKKEDGGDPSFPKTSNDPSSPLGGAKVEERGMRAFS